MAKLDKKSNNARGGDNLFEAIANNLTNIFACSLHQLQKDIWHAMECVERNDTDGATKSLRRYFDSDASCQKHVAHLLALIGNKDEEAKLRASKEIAVELVARAGKIRNWQIGSHSRSDGTLQEVYFKDLSSNKFDKSIRIPTKIDTAYFGTISPASDKIYTSPQMQDRVLKAVINKVLATTPIPCLTAQHYTPIVTLTMEEIGELQKSNWHTKHDTDGKSLAPTVIKSLKLRDYEQWRNSLILLSNYKVFVGGAKRGATDSGYFSRIEYDERGKFKIWISEELKRSISKGYYYLPSYFFTCEHDNVNQNLPLIIDKLSRQYQEHRHKSKGGVTYLYSEIKVPTLLACTMLPKSLQELNDKHWRRRIVEPIERCLNQCLANKFLTSWRYSKRWQTFEEWQAVKVVFEVSDGVFDSEPTMERVSFEMAQMLLAHDTDATDRATPSKEEVRTTPLPIAPREEELQYSEGKPIQLSLFGY